MWSIFITCLISKITTTRVNVYLETSLLFRSIQPELLLIPFSPYPCSLSKLFWISHYPSMYLALSFPPEFFYSGSDHLFYLLPLQRNSTSYSRPSLEFTLSLVPSFPEYTTLGELLASTAHTVLDSYIFFLLWRHVIWLCYLISSFICLSSQLDSKHLENRDQFGLTGPQLLAQQQQSSKEVDELLPSKLMHCY